MRWGRVGFVTGVALAIVMAVGLLTPASPDGVLSIANATVPSPTGVPTGVPTVASTATPAPTSTSTPAPSGGGGGGGGGGNPAPSSAAGAPAADIPLAPGTQLLPLPAGATTASALSTSLLTGANAPLPRQRAFPLQRSASLWPETSEWSYRRGRSPLHRGGLVHIAIQPAPQNLPIPGGPAQFSFNGTIMQIVVTDGNGNPYTTFPVPMPLVFHYNAADISQARGNVNSLTAGYFVDANTPFIANPNHFPIGTLVIAPPSSTTLDTVNGNITFNTQAIGSTFAVVTNPVGYVQTVNPNAQEQSSFDPNNSQAFGGKPQFSYLQVVEPQIGTRLLVLDPTNSNFACINATDVGPSGPPPSTASTAVVRGDLTRAELAGPTGAAGSSANCSFERYAPLCRSCGHPWWQIHGTVGRLVHKP